MFRQYSFSYYIDNQVIATLAAAAALSFGLPQRVLGLLRPMFSEFSKVFLYAKIAVLWLLLLGSMCMIVNGNYSPFIYFRF